MKKIEYSIEPFERSYASELSALIRRVLIEVNGKDYDKDEMLLLAEGYEEDKLIELSEKRDIFVALSDKDKLGLGGIEAIGSGEEYYISSVFVLPELQGMGIGRAVMEKLIDFAVQKGARLISLHSSITALGFYEGLGFENLGFDSEFQIYEMNLKL